MTKQKARMTQLKKSIESQESRPKQTKRKEELMPNAPRGERMDYLKITITMPADLLGELKSFGVKRKAMGEKDTDTSSLVRQAIADFLKKHSDESNY